MDDLQSIAGVAVKKTIVKVDAPTIIFLHDSLGCIDLWRDFPALLGTMSGMNIVAYDRHGYGKSGAFTKERDHNYLEDEADLLHVLIQHLNLTQVILFGHSDGGSIALIYAAKFRGKVKAVITEGAHVFVEEETVRGIESAIEAYNTTNLKERLERYHGNNTDAMFWAWADIWTSREFRTWSIEKFLPLVNCPIMIIQGEKDEYGTLDQVKSITEKVRGTVSMLIVPGVGHSPHKDAEELVLCAASEFIAKLNIS